MRGRKEKEADWPIVQNARPDRFRRVGLHKEDSSAAAAALLTESGL